MGETPPRDVRPLLRAAVALYDRFRRTREELSEAQRILAERKRIDQAKRCFMNNEKTSEAQAHRWLQRRAMQTSRRLAVIAEEYLASQKKDDLS